MKKELLLRRFEQLETSRQKLLADLADVNELILYKKPVPGKWNITQIIYHLQFSEGISAGYVKKKMQGGNALKKTGATAMIRSTLLKWLLLSGYKWKAPPMLGNVPEELLYSEVISCWEESRKTLFSLIDTMPEDLAGREIYRHPRAGRLNLFHMLDFFQDHFDHHLLQIKRITSNSMNRF
jgi:hypothetical protein